jgi:pimeloyl-ACP methyl ester carboxylesterase
LTVTHINIGDQRVEYLLTDGTNNPKTTIVFLHEGLGSLALWKDFPRALGLATECSTLIYSRLGYGESTPLSSPRKPVRISRHAGHRFHSMPVQHFT